MSMHLFPFCIAFYSLAFSLSTRSSPLPHPGVSVLLGFVRVIFLFF